MSTTAPNTQDIVIAGAGYVGLVTALAIKNAAPDLSITIADAAPKDIWKKDMRASAIAAAARRMLEQLDCWDHIDNHAQPIHEMIVTDSRQRDPVKPVFLTFDGTVQDGEPFAHMVPNVELVRSLRNQLEARGVTVTQGTAIADFTRDPGAASTTGEIEYWGLNGLPKPERRLTPSI